MNPKTIALCKHVIQANEGFRSERYKDTKGIWTIGFGHNLKASGMDVTQIDLPLAERLFDEDFEKHLEDARKLPEFDHVDQLVKLVLTDMVYQMGLGSVMGFKNMRKALAVDEEKITSRHLLDSKYARDDSPARAKRNAKIMREPLYWNVKILNIGGLTKEQNLKKQYELNNILLS